MLRSHHKSTSHCDKFPELAEYVFHADQSLRKKLSDAVPHVKAAVRHGGNHRGNATEALHRISSLMHKFNEVC